jgi:hypothetical protein
MEFKGTKGKWNTFNDRVEQRGQFTDYVICRFEPRMSRESEANALLISKAPEMLEMLKTTSNCLWMLNTKGTNELAEEIDKLIEESTEI